MTADEIAELLRVVAVRALVWKEDHGVAMLGPYRLFEAETPIGRYVYGTDAEGVSYYHTHSSGIQTVGDEAKAKQLAEAAWEKAALSEIGKYASRDLPAAPDVGEEKPVAWRYRDDGHTWEATIDSIDARDLAKDGFTVEPLYAAKQVARLCNQAKREAYAECRAIAERHREEHGAAMAEDLTPEHRTRARSGLRAARAIKVAIEALAEKKP
ncbi:MAG: hypothetical protein M9937_26320 [Chelatococcus sp.]|uniref:hypothetical protein n=1 Tax=Chelatococcus sp. TaxID=1953771 RepID=UPI0026397CEB|nr:hypothetical protein [Chelatococcus sp.]MCO5079188.1 hypothetical protein [Chelatococcus sp.]